jgi:hypothetical protein
MDTNKIFDLFGQTEFDTPLEKKARAADELLNFQDTPMFWLGMFKKLILNNQNFYHQLLSLLPKEFNPEATKLDEASEFVVFLRGWYYIQKINLNRKLDQESLQMYSSEELEVCLKLSIHFFEEREEYEKCAHLKNILDFIQSI